MPSWHTQNNLHSCIAFTQQMCSCLAWADSVLRARGTEGSEASLCPPRARVQGKKEAWQLTTGSHDGRPYTKGAYRVSQDDVTIYYLQGSWKTWPQWTHERRVWVGQSKQKECWEKPTENEHTVRRDWWVGLGRSGEGVCTLLSPVPSAVLGTRLASAPIYRVWWARKGSAQAMKGPKGLPQ